MALEDRIAAAQHFRNAGFRNLDIGALFIAQALDRITDALEARTGADAPDSAPTPPQEPPAAPSAAQDASQAPQTGWITHRAPEEADGDEDGEVFVKSRSGMHTVAFPWDCVYPGTPWGHI